MIVNTSKPIKKYIKHTITESMKKNVSTNNSKKGAADTSIEMPTSVTDYTNRLVSHKKEMYKNPPGMPPNFPDRVEIYTKRESLPTRASNRDIIFGDAKQFKPNRSPEEVLRAGSFGGTYFRPIHSAVTNIKYKSSEVLNDTV